MLADKSTWCSWHHFIPKSCGLLALVLLVPLMLLPQKAAADHLLGSHGLKCDKIFPCPDELKPRVSFWIDVFTQHGDDTIILHDPENPQRVYKVIKTTARCSRRNEARSIKNAKASVRKQLLQIADKRAQGVTQFSGEKQHLAELVKNEKPAEIRKAAKQIGRASCRERVCLVV